MNPIVIAVEGRSDLSPEAICAQVLDLTRWPEFEGHGLLPGIARAIFENRAAESVHAHSDDVLGTRIRVFSRDGSEHVEEIVEWDLPRRIALRFQDFRSPLRWLATGFVETWTFRPEPRGFHMRREMAMYPKGVLGWCVLRMISRMMRQAFVKQARTMGVITAPVAPVPATVPVRGLRDRQARSAPGRWREYGRDDRL